MTNTYATYLSVRKIVCHLRADDGHFFACSDGGTVFVELSGLKEQ